MIRKILRKYSNRRSGIVIVLQHYHIAIVSHLYRRVDRNRIVSHSYENNSKTYRFVLCLQESKVDFEDNKGDHCIEYLAMIKSSIQKQVVTKSRASGMSYSGIDDSEKRVWTPSSLLSPIYKARFVGCDL